MTGQTFLDGSQNLAALTVPGVYVDIIPPAPIIVGVPTNIVGLVGTGTWGPVNSPVNFNTLDDCAGIFGFPQVRSYDLATYVAAASSIGGSIAFAGVRVTDGTDTAASVVALTNCITFTAKYTGTRGNGISVTIQNGSKASSYCAVVNFPGRTPERFDNITGSGNAFWVALASAINNGTILTGKSNFIVAAAGVGTTAAALASYALSGGTDGVTSITTAVLVGTDTSPRSGMYALRGTNVSAFTLCDLVDPTSWPTADTFALSESSYAVNSRPSGDTISAAVTARTTAALDSAWSKIVVGDYTTFFDTYNGLSRLVSPVAFFMGIYGNLSPQLSPLNRQLRGIVSTQRTAQFLPYASADIQQAEIGGVDLIVGPPTTPGGNYFTAICGHNTSSNVIQSGDEWTLLTNFIARSLQSYAAGQIVGSLQSTLANDPTRNRAKMLLDGFFATLADPTIGVGGYGMIQNWAVTCDNTNNTPQTIQRGLLFAFCQVQYLNTVRFFVIKLAGGGNVDVSSQATIPSAAQFK